MKMTVKDKVSKTENSWYACFALLVTASTLPFLVGFNFTFINPLVPTLQAIYNDTYMIKRFTMFISAWWLPKSSVFSGQEFEEILKNIGSLETFKQMRYNATMSEQTWRVLLSLSASSSIVCAIIATVTAKFFLAIISPKRLQQIAHVVNIVAIVIMALGTGLTGSYEAFIIGRLLHGLGFGIAFVVVPMQMSEMSAPKERGRWQSVFVISISCGMLMGPVLAHPDMLGSMTLFPVVICVGAIPSLLYLSSSPFIYNSPYYYIRNGRIEKATKILRKMRKSSNEIIRFEVEEIKSEIGKDTKGLVGIKEILKRAKYRNQFIGVLVLLSNKILIGITNVAIYSSFLFIQAGFDKRVAGFATIAISCLQFLSSLFGPKTVKKIGAFRLCIGSNVLLISSLLLFTFSSALAHLAENVLPFVSIVAVALFMVIWNAGINIGTYALISEITIEPTRATCMTYGNVALWVSVWVVGFTPPYLQLVFGPFSMILWIVFGFLFTLYMIFCLPDTRGKSQQQIQQELDGSFLKRRLPCLGKTQNFHEKCENSSHKLEKI